MKPQRPFHVNKIINKWEEDHIQKMMDKKIKAAKSTLPDGAKGYSTNKGKGSTTTQGTNSNTTAPYSTKSPSKSNSAGSRRTPSHSETGGLPDLVDTKHMNIHKIDDMIYNQMQGILGLPLIQRIQDKSYLKLAAAATPLGPPRANSRTSNTSIPDPDTHTTHPYHSSPASPPEHSPHAVAHRFHQHLLQQGADMVHGVHSPPHTSPGGGVHPDGHHHPTNWTIAHHPQPHTINTATHTPLLVEPKAQAGIRSYSRSDSSKSSKRGSDGHGVAAMELNALTAVPASCPAAVHTVVKVGLEHKSTGETGSPSCVSSPSRVGSATSAGSLTARNRYASAGGGLRSESTSPHVGVVGRVDSEVAESSGGLGLRAESATVAGGLYSRSESARGAGGLYLRSESGTGVGVLNLRAESGTGAGRLNLRTESMSSNSGKPPIPGTPSNSAGERRNPQASVGSFTAGRTSSKTGTPDEADVEIPKILLLPSSPQAAGRTGTRPISAAARYADQKGGKDDGGGHTSANRATKSQPITGFKNLQAEGGSTILTCKSDSSDMTVPPPKKQYRSLMRLASKNSSRGESSDIYVLKESLQALNTLLSLKIQQLSVSSQPNPPPQQQTGPPSYATPSVEGQQVFVNRRLSDEPPIGCEASIESGITSSLHNSDMEYLQQCGALNVVPDWAGIDRQCLHSSVGGVSDIEAGAKVGTSACHENLLPLTQTTTSSDGSPATHPHANAPHPSSASSSPHSRQKTTTQPSAGSNISNMHNTPRQHRSSPTQTGKARESLEGLDCSQILTGRVPISSHELTHNAQQSTQRPHEVAHSSDKGPSNSGNTVGHGVSGSGGCMNGVGVEGVQGMELGQGSGQWVGTAECEDEMRMTCSSGDIPVAFNMDGHGPAGSSGRLLHGQGTFTYDEHLIVGKSDRASHDKVHTPMAPCDSSAVEAGHGKAKTNEEEEEEYEDDFEEPLADGDEGDQLLDEEEEEMEEVLDENGVQPHVDDLHHDQTHADLMRASQSLAGKLHQLRQMMKANHLTSVFQPGNTPATTQQGASDGISPSAALGSHSEAMGVEQMDWLCGLVNTLTTSLQVDSNQHPQPVIPAQVH